MSSIEDYKLQYLIKLYERTDNGSPQLSCSKSDIGCELNFDETLTIKITKALKSEGLIEFLSFQIIKITSDGINRIQLISSSSQ